MHLELGTREFVLASSPNRNNAKDEAAVSAEAAASV